MKTSGFNFIDVKKDNKTVESILNMEKLIEKPTHRRRKKKIDFSNILPKPKNNENMGMDNFGTGKPFEGLI